MNREAIFHNPVSNYAFPISYEKFKVRLRAGKGDLDRVTLVIGNKYLWHTRKEVPMEVEGSDELFDYYSYVYPVDDPRVAYYFLLEKGDEQWLYGDSGFAKPELVNIDEDESSAFVNFHFPFINRIDIHKKPSWVNSAVFYQIFPERFCNGNPKLSPENVAPWGTAPDRQIFMGGDLPGITQKLSYLEELGVNALYLTPIFEATSNHKYDTVDYTRIDPHFGDESDLVELINQAHKRGIRVILDGVFNHCGGGFRQFQDVVEHGEESPFRDWFYIREFPVSFDPLNFDSFGDTPYTPRHPGLKNLSEEQLRTACMPKWNTENPQAKEYLLGAVAKWTRMGIDGWRLDVATEVDSHFCNISPHLKSNIEFFGHFFNHVLNPSQFLDAYPLQVTLDLAGQSPDYSQAETFESQFDPSAQEAFQAFFRFPFAPDTRWKEIGRASCRERV